MPLLSTFGAASARSFGGIGAAAAGAGLDVDEVFSTFVYDGNSSSASSGTTQTINNGIDLSGEGGLVWIKRRDGNLNHALFDTARGAGAYFASNLTAGHYAGGDDLTSFNSNGFTLGDGQFTSINYSSYEYVSWTFRKAPKFFDVVTYTGNNDGSKLVSHNLGSTPGLILAKRTDSTDNWMVYVNAGSGITGFSLNTTNAAIITNANTVSYADGNANFSSAHFRPSIVRDYGNDDANNNGATYVAYLFANNNSDGKFGPNADQDIIKCGSYAGQNSGGTDIDVNLGFEPQWLLLKPNASASWYILDNMRGIATGGNSERLFPNNSNAETSTTGVALTPTGFTVTAGSELAYASGYDILYMAIRRGPLAEPTSATKVFAIDTQVNQDPPLFDSGFPVDFALTRNVSSTANWAVGSRLIQGKQLQTNLTNAESSNPVFEFDFMDGWNSETLSTNSNVYSWMWKRAPGYFDVVAYTGTGSARTVSHNLGVAPEMIWVKKRSGGTGAWPVYHVGAHASSPENYFLQLNSTIEATDNSARWNDTAPTATEFTVGNGGTVNDSGDTYIAYLFATLAGVSKVGSYTGNNTDGHQIDCGFSSGARFVLIKNATVSATNWLVFDTARGIVAGNDSRLYLNTSDSENSGTDYIDPYSSGFELTANAQVNYSGSTYIFYAIA